MSRVKTMVALVKNTVCDIMLFVLSLAINIKTNFNAQQSVHKKAYL